MDMHRWRHPDSLVMRTLSALPEFTVAAAMLWAWCAPLQLPGALLQSLFYAIYAEAMLLVAVAYAYRMDASDVLGVAGVMVIFAVFSGFLLEGARTVREFLLAIPLFAFATFTRIDLVIARKSANYQQRKRAFFLWASLASGLAAAYAVFVLPMPLLGMGESFEKQMASNAFWSALPEPDGLLQIFTFFAPPHLLMAFGVIYFATGALLKLGWRARWLAPFSPVSGNLEMLERRGRDA